MSIIRDGSSRVARQPVVHAPARSRPAAGRRSLPTDFDEQQREAERIRREYEADIRRAQWQSPREAREADAALDRALARGRPRPEVVVAGSSTLAVVFFGLGLWALRGRRAKRPAPKEADARGRRAAYLAARRADLTEGDLEALWRMVQSENPSAPEATHVEQVWAVINRAYKRGVSVRRLLMPEDKPAHQKGGKPPFSTWRPAGPDGKPIPSPRDAARRAERLVNQDPFLEGATEFFDPDEQEAVLAQAERLRARHGVPSSMRGKPSQVLAFLKDKPGLSERDRHIAATYWTTREEFRARRAGKSLGRVGPVEFFRS